MLYDTHLYCALRNVILCVSNFPQGALKGAIARLVGTVIHDCFLDSRSSLPDGHNRSSFSTRCSNLIHVSTIVPDSQ